MSTTQKYVGRGTCATETPNPSPSAGQPYRLQIVALVQRVARQSGLAESVIWANIYARLESHYQICLSVYPRNHKESLLRLAERNDLLEPVYNCTVAEGEVWV